MPRFSILLTIALSLFSVMSFAQESYVDLRDVNIQGAVKEITAPNLLKVVTLQNNEERHLWVEFAYLDFGSMKNSVCKRSYNPEFLSDMKVSTKWFSRDKGLVKRCKEMKQWLKGQNVSIEVVEWGSPVLRGNVFLDKNNLNNAMLSKGWYKVDHSQSRDASLLLLEKETRCAYKGIWASLKNDPVERLKCQNKTNEMRSVYAF